MKGEIYQDLCELRDEDEVIAYFEGMGIQLTEDQLNILKGQFQLSQNK